MEINIEIREKQLASLEQFISSSKQGLNTILQTLNWSADNLRNEESLVSCSLNPHHLVPHKSLQEHIKTCSLKNLGYKLNDEFLSEPKNDPKASIYIDNQKKLEIVSQIQTSSNSFTAEIIIVLTQLINILLRWNVQDPDPKTSDRLLSTYTPNQRLAFYDFTKSKTSGPPILPEFNVTQIVDENKELTYEEILEQERNAKRRRIKYKTVHTSHKNHTEILRDVIKNQMESYEEWIAEKEGKSDDRILDQSLESIEAARSTTSCNSTHSANSRDSRSNYSKESHKRISQICDERSRHKEERSKDYKNGRHREFREEKHKEYRMRSYEKPREYRSEKSREFRNSKSLAIREGKNKGFREGRIQNYEEKYRDYKRKSGEYVDKHRNRVDKHS